MCDEFLRTFIYRISRIRNTMNHFWFFNLTVFHMTQLFTVTCFNISLYLVILFLTAAITTCYYILLAAFWNVPIVSFGKIITVSLKHFFWKDTYVLRNTYRCKSVFEQKLILFIGKTLPTVESNSNSNLWITFPGQSLKNHREISRSQYIHAR